MKALLILGIFACGLVGCGDGGKKDSAAELPEEVKPSRAKLTALSDSKPGTRSKKPPAKPAADQTAIANRQVVLPVDIQNDPEAMARREEVRQKAAIARAQAEARRAEERAVRVAEFTERLSTRLGEMDANGDGFLAKEEVSGPLERRFADSDTNSDGFLDATEQAAIFEAMSERMSAGSAQGRDGRRGVGGRGNFGGGRGVGAQGRGRN
jgi:hypothetical protein